MGSAGCIPWFLPRLNEHNVCSPFQNKNFSDASDAVDPETACKHCLPDCSGTEYTFSQSEAEFRWEARLVELSLSRIAGPATPTT